MRKKSHVLCLIYFLTVILSSCGQDYIELKSEQSDSEFELQSYTRDSYVLTKDEVLQNLDLFLSKNASFTRSSGFSISSIDGIKSSNNVTRSGNIQLPDTAFYIVNFEGGGFAILPKDLRGGSVYAFSEKNSFYVSDTIACPEKKFVLELALDNLEEQIDTYDERMRGIDEKELRTRTNVQLASVEPLVKVEWGQGDPINPNAFNLLAPVVDGKYSYAGCVATAMCQIMSFWGVPERAKVSGTKLSSPISWGIMKSDVNYKTHYWNNTNAPDLSVLFRAAGEEVNMNYSPQGSGAYDYKVPAAMTQMGYTSDSYSRYYDIDAAIHELQGYRRPIYVSGTRQSGQSGHAWVVDGFKEVIIPAQRCTVLPDGSLIDCVNYEYVQKQLHCNWGWQHRPGDNTINNWNGYYAIFNPREANNPYRYNLYMIQNIEPKINQGGRVEVDVYHGFINEPYKCNFQGTNWLKVVDANLVGGQDSLLYDKESQMLTFLVGGRYPVYFDLTLERRNPGLLSERVVVRREYTPNKIIDYSWGYECIAGKPLCRFFIESDEYGLPFYIVNGEFICEVDLEWKDMNLSYPLSGLMISFDLERVNGGERHELLSYDLPLECFGNDGISEGEVLSLYDTIYLSHEFEQQFPNYTWDDKYRLYVTFADLATGNIISASRTVPGVVTNFWE